MRRELGLAACTLALALLGCHRQASSEGEVGSGSESGPSSTTSGSETGTTGETGETDETGETGETGEPEPEPPVYPELPEPVPGEQPCASRALDPDRVLGAFARNNYDTPELSNALFFVRADGSREVIAESFDHRYRLVHGRGERVLVDVRDIDADISTLRVFERQTGAELWSHPLPYPSAFKRLEVIGDGQVLVHTSPYQYILFDAEGTILSEGTGNPAAMAIREDGWIPLRLTDATSNIERADFAWAHADSGEVLEPSYEFAPNPGGVRFTPSGELVYPAIVEGQWTVVVEEPGELTVVPAPELAPLVADDWYIRLLWPLTWSIPGIEWTRHNSEWSFFAAQSPGDNLWASTHALDPDDLLAEFSPSPPPGASATPCPIGAHDGEGRLLWPWFDGVSTWIWREQTPGQWTRVGLPVQTDEVDVAEIAGTVIICANDPVVFCDGLEWGELPTDAQELGDDECLYVRGDSMFIADNLWFIEFDPSGHCIAHSSHAFESGGTEWTIHDLERNESFVLPGPEDIGVFTWFLD